MTKLTQLDHIIAAFTYELRDEWITLERLGKYLGIGEASLSAQLRNLRKPEYGAHTVEKRLDVERGKWEYRVVA